ncbi:hypothetical protein GCM10027413_21710 [Conyzicola nivalis]|uniref:DUF4184 family protein n=1 Tax=Conyzicola nivalis TaxID=1477021 RepID=A0A916SCK3_9MICO|nr:DUF4184 family protein [Conyzicola nivalis]GGA93375.1 hypothetical protein GCM10010979_04910 [Conyzicola nivalis]
MPFTPSHAAAILPFARTPLVPAALVVGSVMPDLFYFVPGDVERGFSHSLIGAVTLDLGVGMIVFALWQVVFRRPAGDFAPYWLRARLPRSRARPSADYVALAAASILIGIATHLVWDAFTHRGWLTGAAPWTGAELGGLPLVTWLQHASSVLGALFLGVWFVLWVRRTPQGEVDASRLDRRSRIAGWAVVGVPVLAVGAGYWVWRMGEGVVPLDPHLLFSTARLCIGSAALLAVLLCLGWWAARPGSRRSPDLGVGGRR